MEYLWTFGTISSAASCYYLINNIIERSEMKKVQRMLDQGRISSVEEIVKTSREGKNVKDMAGFVSSSHRKTINALFEGNLGLHNNRNPIRIVDQGLNTELITMVIS